jgi:hypothetical protein
VELVLSFGGDISVEFVVENEAGTCSFVDGDDEDTQQEQALPTEGNLATGQGSSEAVPDLLQPPASNTMQTFSHAENSAAGFSTPQHTMPVNDYSTPLSTESSEPMRFRALNEIYDETIELELMDSDVEALLAETEESSCYREAADHQDWVDAMNKEMQSIF